MRLISGRLKRLTLKVPRNIRPTEDKVRKSLFDILAGSIEKTSFLDLFAGSGSVGLEAFSRGAKEIFFVEKDRRVIKILKKNLNAVLLREGPCAQVKNRIELISKDAFSAIENFADERRKFDIVFLDPPYYKGMAKKTLKSLGQYDILTRFGIVIAQIYKKEIIPQGQDYLTLYRRISYGDTLLLFYKKSLNK